MEDLVDFDLAFYDVTKPELVGLHKEFMSCPRLDDMMGSIVATRAFAAQAAAANTDDTVDMLIMYDTEEVGSVSYQGAGGTLHRDAVERVYNAFIPSQVINTKTMEQFKICMKSSLFLSCDNGHALHPNYAEVMEINHRPMLQ